MQNVMDMDGGVAGYWLFNCTAMDWGLTSLWFPVRWVEDDLDDFLLPSL